MKIVLSWVFDHIQSDTSSLEARDIVSKLSTMTTEIAYCREIDRTKVKLILARVTEIQQEMVVCVDGATNQTYTVARRSDGVERHQTYLLVLESTGARFARATDLGSDKDSFLPAILPGTKLPPSKEIVLEIDNNAISHRPDLWSHRGFAREIATIYGLTLRPIESIIVSKRLIVNTENVAATYESPFSITVENTKMCRRFAGLSVSKVKNQPASLELAARLSLIDCRSINALVDYSNYVMFDLGQPIHVYDANALSQKRIVVRTADPGAELMLLDGEKITLTNDDLIVADGLEPVALAGIMGGLDTGITIGTESVFVEAACFSSSLIRTTAARHKKRTEASTRFEKSVDPNQNVVAIGRFLFLLESAGIECKSAPAIQSIGSLALPSVIRITHDFIEKRLGWAVQSTDVVRILAALGCVVQKQEQAYNVTPPSFRGRDLLLQEDLVEEIGRFLGYQHGVLTLPHLATTRKDVGTLFRLRALKSILSFSFLMRELHTYSVADERFLKRISYEPQNRVALLNPVSAHQTHLVTSLIPNLLAAVAENAERENELRFYEVARCFYQNDDETISERTTVAGVWFSKAGHTQFYEGKQYIEQLLKQLRISVEYVACGEVNFPWQDVEKSAEIVYAGKKVGMFGMLAESLKTHLFAQGDCFYFECDAEFIEQAPILVRVTEQSKYPTVLRDFSILVSKNLTASAVQKFFTSDDPRIRSVQLVDFFEKKEWKDKRALTFRLTIQDEHKTLLSLEVEEIVAPILKHLQEQNIEVR